MSGSIPAASFWSLASLDQEGVCVVVADQEGIYICMYMCICECSRSVYACVNECGSIPAASFWSLASLDPSQSNQGINGLILAAVVWAGRGWGDEKVD